MYRKMFTNLVYLRCVLAPSGDIKWAVSDGDKATYDRFFKSADKDGDGLVDGIYFRSSNSCWS